MDYEKREEIFSKEALTIDDVVALTGRSRQTASVLIRQWKRQVEKKNGFARIQVEGTIHVLDYFEVMRIDAKSPGPRYTKRNKFENWDESAGQVKKSVCV